MSELNPTRYVPRETLAEDLRRPGNRYGQGRVHWLGLEIYIDNRDKLISSR